VPGGGAPGRLRCAVCAVAAELGISWPVAHRHYAAHADTVLTEPEPPAVLGVDETAAAGRSGHGIRARAGEERTERFETNFTSLAGGGRLLGRVAGRTGKAVTGWLDDRGQ